MSCYHGRYDAHTGPRPPTIPPDCSAVIPWELLDTATVPGGAGQLRLLRRGTEYAIRIDGADLMNSRLSGSEEALATLACRSLTAPDAPHVLIGGLGMGFTLRAALSVLGPDASVTVAELVPAVVAWANGPMAALFGESLRDPRVRVIEADVGEVIRAGRRAYGAILLDVDNGPEGLTRTSNDRLYSTAGLTDARNALRPGGVLAVWSARPYPPFTKHLQKLGFAVEEVRVRADRGKRGAAHAIWLATKR